MAVNWYPGHMVKAKREMAKQMNHVDVVIHLLDARAPWSCLHPHFDFDKILQGKPRLYVISKADLADPRHTPAGLITSNNTWALLWSQGSRGLPLE